MLRQSIKNASRLNSVYIFSLIFFSALSFTAQAQSSIGQQESPKNISVSYIGTDDDMVVYSVSFSNPRASVYNFSIYNKAGEVLYRNSFQQKKFSKKIKVPKEQGELDFILEHAAEKITERIKLNDAVFYSIAENIK